jgi:hypothetical protein
MLQTFPRNAASNRLAKLKTLKMSVPRVGVGALFAGRFQGLICALFECELAIRSEGHEPRSARRQRFSQRPCGDFQPQHKNLCQHRDHSF